MQRCPIASITAALVAAALARGATAQQETWRVDGDVRQQFLGRSIALLPDFDGDGTADLLVGAPGTLAGEGDGVALVLSGDDLALIRTLDGGGGENLGSAVADAGDVDGDGVTDLFVGAPNDDVAYLFSGATGAVVRRYASSAPFTQFGSAGAALGDSDGDGVPDLAIGAPLELVAGTTNGAIHASSTATGALLWRVDGQHDSAQFGGRGRMAAIGDVDGDGVLDLAALDVEQRAVAPRGMVRVLSGADGTELLVFKFIAGDYLDYSPSTVASIADVDGDGTIDVLVGALPNRVRDPARAYVFSGADLSEIVRADAGDHASFVSVAPHGDFDGDAIPDLVIATTTLQALDTPLISLRSGRDGSELASFLGTTGTLFGEALAAGADFDGDGIGDVVAGDWLAQSGSIQVGSVTTVRWAPATTIATRFGSGGSERFSGDVALLDDLDGDGRNDFIAANSDSPGRRYESVRLLSGADGRVLQSFSMVDSPNGALIAVPDQDGDGHDDFAIGVAIDSTTPAVELRSSVSGALLQRFDGPTGAVSGFGQQLAIGVQPNGAHHLAIAAPASAASKPIGGAVDVFDLATGTRLFQRLAVRGNEQLGSALAFLGDMNGDGTRDWAFGAPFNGKVDSEAGRVSIVSGATGKQIIELFGTRKQETLGMSITGLSDLDGDSIDELAIAAPGSSGSRGEVRIFSGGSWLPYATVTGENALDMFGGELATLSDLNGDGTDEWMAMARWPGRFVIVSGATLRPLAELPSDPIHYARVATPAPWQVGSMNGDAFPDLVATDASLNGWNSQAWLTVLDDLLLQIDPPVAEVGEVVRAGVRGAPAGMPSALELVAIDGVPTSTFLAFGLFDVNEEWSVGDTVPPSLAGIDWTLRAYAIGHGGRIVSSLDQAVRFE